MPDCIIDGDGVSARDAVLMLASFLYAEAAAESVRTREAIAATIANQVERLLSGTAAGDVRSRRAALFLECLNRCARTEARPLGTSDPVFACCFRIARRAVSGALQDPTGGAVRFHELGKTPEWASGLNTSAWIGSYLFYGDREPTQANASGNAPNAVEPEVAPSE